ncbi:hypothetical protein [Nocardiopsis salina]|uniref:hypothetical protein n=1 Tax=Nocardiopsis salina TaxID=245836 RepID=UPI0003820915|nr:hypothetical protein [Nocardiopsis salina]
MRTPGCRRDPGGTRNVLRGLGAYLAVAGVSGAVDHVWPQPVLGLSLDRFVVPHVDVLDANAVTANLGPAVLGAAVFTAATVAARR